MISDQAGRAIIRYMSKLSAAFEELHRALEAVAFADVTSTEMQLKWQIELWRKYADDLKAIVLNREQSLSNCWNNTPPKGMRRFVFKTFIFSKK